MMPTETRKGELCYLDHQFDPNEILNFVELPLFSRAWEKELGLSVETDLWELQAAIMARPQAGTVVKGTESLRKIRFSPATANVGSRGGFRVLYVHVPRHAFVVLVYAYYKSRREDFDRASIRYINEQIRRVESFLDSGRLMT